MVILHLHKSQKLEWLQSLLHKPAVLHCCCFSNCPEHHGSAGVCDSSRRSRRDCRTALGCNRAVQCSDMSWNSHVLEASFDTCCLCVWQAVEVLQHSVHTGKMIMVKMAVATEDAFRCQVCATAPFQNRQLLCGLSWKSRLCEHSRAAPVQSEVSWLRPPPAVVFQSCCCLMEMKCWSYLCCRLRCGNAAPVRRAVINKIMLLVKAATC